jgi:hypothetical protein
MPPFHTLPKRAPDPREKEAHTVNQAAFDRVKDDLPNRYPHLQWVAFSEGEIVADDANVTTLMDRLEKQLGLNPRYCMLHRVGEEWPDNPLPLSFRFYGMRG